MWQMVNGVRVGLAAAAFALFTSHTALAVEITGTHIPTPQVRVPTPQVRVPTPQVRVPSPQIHPRVPNIHGPIPNVVVPGVINKGSSCSSGDCDNARGKRPVDKRNPSGSGEPASAIMKYRLFHFIPDTSVGSIYAAIAEGGDDSAYAVVFQAYQAAITTAEQALTIASQCAVDPSLPQCASAESVPQAQQNLSDAQNALMDFYTDMQYLLSLLTFVELAPNYGDPAAEMGAIEVAIQECLASPSTCDATIAQLNAVLAELGVPSTVSVSVNGESFTVGVLYTQPEIAYEFAGNGPLNPWQYPLSYLMSWPAFGWYVLYHPYTL